MSQIDARLAEALNKVLVPGIMRSLVQMNLVRSAEVSGGKARVTLASTAIPAQQHESLKDRATAALTKLAAVEAVTVDLVQAKPKELNQIEKIIAVMSGKGGSREIPGWWSTGCLLRPGRNGRGRTRRRYHRAQYP